MYYSFIDLETTGFSPRLNDKIIEVGIIKIDERGNVVESFESLVNPNRDVGATFIHGITAEMIIDAPSFEEIAINILNILNGSIIVAHNAQFDIRFLTYELECAGYSALELPYLCTLQIARKRLRFLPSKKLECLCDYYDIEYHNKHSAMHDCRATCEIFKNLHVPQEMSKSDLQPLCINKLNKHSLSNSRVLTRKEAKIVAQNFKSPIEKLINRLPEVETEFDEEKQYLSVLDEILLDRFITEKELDSILDIAKEYNITKDTFQNLNIKYLKNLIRVYLEDNHISERERLDIEKVKRLLVLDYLDTNKLINEVKDSHFKIINCSNKKKYTGKSVCFTGQLNSKIDQSIVSRKKAHEIAMSKGLIIKNTVVMTLDYLVLSDVHSNSGKAKKAKKYGTTLISENAFWSMLGVQVD